jgi:hypothetical protein
MAATVPLHVALQDGFDDDRVTVDVGGSHHELDRVKTRTQIGLAHELEIDVEPGAVEVRVSLPGRGIDAGTDGTVVGETWLGVSVAGDTIELSWSEAPFLYA